MAYKYPVHMAGYGEREVVMQEQQSIGSFEFNKNGFDIIRYWAAFSVMFLHFTGYALQLSNSGTAVMSGLRKVVSFFPGVVVLFSLSGFLIAASYERSKSRKEFFVKRVVRMYPELWVCTLVNLIVVCVLAYSLLDRSIVTWLLTQVVGIANTPSCLKSFGLFRKIWCYLKGNGLNKRKTG